MASPTRGLHEALITEALAAELEQLDASLVATRRALDRGEAADRIALSLARTVRRLLEDVNDGRRVEEGIDLLRELLTLLASRFPGHELAGDRPVPPGEVLRQIGLRLPTGAVEAIPEPMTPLLDTTLLVNASDGGRIGNQLQSEIASADGIDAIVAFIRRSGIRPLLGDLAHHVAAGRRCRILTTTYTGSTELAALEELAAAGVDVRVSYDTSSTRLHAKAWLFHRQSGYDTAFIGSSNLTHQAQTAGLEWNVRLSGARNPDAVRKVAVVFDSYWESDDFVPFDPEQFRESQREAQRDGPQVFLSALELRLQPFQERLLELIALERDRGRYRNLLVAATGTGKTVMAAVDYERLTRRLPRARLLFVAHRREILQQARATFRHAMRDTNFGELWVDGERPTRFDHVFASVQSLAQGDLTRFARDHFDVLVVDEFHHAAAQSYRPLFEYFEPRELLGLTATPERADGLDVLSFFGGRIAAELRLWDAIEQHRLTPFQYYGIGDDVDLSQVPWRRGVGYDTHALTGVLTANDVWGLKVLRALANSVVDLHTMRALGFCVSVAHAEFMAGLFQRHGIAAAAVHGGHDRLTRSRALKQLRDGELRIIFSVDIFNEGVDLPDVDTLLLLRPTDSATLFLQQLGRGLRRAEGKAVCSVLDFVAQHARGFRYDRRFRALLGGTRKGLEEQVAKGFPFLPAGCHLELDAIASRHVLENIKQAIPDRWQDKVRELRAFAAAVDGAVTLAGFLAESGLELEDIYRDQQDRNWTALKRDAGLAVAEAGEDESVLLKGIGRLLHVDDLERIELLRRLPDTVPSASEADPAQQRRRSLLRMVMANLLSTDLLRTMTLDECLPKLRDCANVVDELSELAGALEARMSHHTQPLPDHPDVPLRVHGQYSRIELQAAFRDADTPGQPNFREGVRWVRNISEGLLLVTLDKTSERFTPTTAYHDFAKSRTSFHWASQNRTSAASETGLRYQEHVARGIGIHLFTRLGPGDRAFCYLGPATYLRHEGERPMQIDWQLTFPLPGDLFTSMVAAVA